VGLQDDPPTLDLPSVRPFLLRGLELLQSEFDAQTLEILVLDVAAHLRENYGTYSANAALKTGHQILPRSQKILSDITMCLWRDAVDNNSEAALNDIAQIGPTIDLTEIDTAVAPSLVYAVYAALHHREMINRANAYYTVAVSRYIPKGTLRNRIERLRQGEELSLAELDK
jgi:hypothetical protein